jgi:hypothetical protein
MKKKDLYNIEPEIIDKLKAIVSQEGWNYE